GAGGARDGGRRLEFCFFRGPEEGTLESESGAVEDGEVLDCNDSAPTVVTAACIGSELLEAEGEEREREEESVIVAEASDPESVLASPT
ncbi:hypothetical protein B8W95_13260, partial [Staphylococcus pasteuri]